MSKLHYLIAMAAISQSSTSSPKFHFNECVTVSKGFYSQCSGHVMEFEAPFQYRVSMDNCNGKPVSVIIEESYLSACNKK